MADFSTLLANLIGGYPALQQLQQAIEEAQRAEQLKKEKFGISFESKGAGQGTLNIKMPMTMAQAYQQATAPISLQDLIVQGQQLASTVQKPTLKTIAPLATAFTRFDPRLGFGNIINFLSGFGRAVAERQAETEVQRRQLFQFGMQKALQEQELQREAAGRAFTELSRQAEEERQRAFQLEQQRKSQEFQAMQNRFNNALIVAGTMGEGGVPPDKALKRISQFGLTHEQFNQALAAYYGGRGLYSQNVAEAMAKIQAQAMKQAKKAAGEGITLKDALSINKTLMNIESSDMPDIQKIVDLNGLNSSIGALLSTGSIEPSTYAYLSSLNNHVSDLLVQLVPSQIAQIATLDEIQRIIQEESPKELLRAAQINPDIANMLAKLNVTKETIRNKEALASSVAKLQRSMNLNSEILTNTIYSYIISRPSSKARLQEVYGYKDQSKQAQAFLADLKKLFMKQPSFFSDVGNWDPMMIKDQVEALKTSIVQKAIPTKKEEEKLNFPRAMFTGLWR